MTHPCEVSFEELLAYRFGELSPAAEDRLEEHLFTCARCAARAEAIATLGAGIHALFRRGEISSSASASLIERAEKLGLTLRSYTIEAGASVACTAAPDDDLIVVRLRLSAPGAESVDIETAVTFPDSGTRDASVLTDVALDRQHGELVYAFSGNYVRSLPRSSWVMQARVRTATGEYRVGPYTMNHTPWGELTTNG